MPTPKKENPRPKMIARIHCLARDMKLDLDDPADRATYEAIIRECTGKTSCKTLTRAQLGAVIEAFQRELGMEPPPVGSRGYPGRPATAAPMGTPYRGGSEAYLAKIEAFLASTGRPWKYARAIGKRMHGVDRLEWLTEAQLKGVMLALRGDAKRHGRRTHDGWKGEE